MSMYRVIDIAELIDSLSVMGQLSAVSYTSNRLTAL